MIAVAVVAAIVGGIVVAVGVVAVGGTMQHSIGMTSSQHIYTPSRDPSWIARGADVVVAWDWNRSMG